MLKTESGLKSPKSGSSCLSSTTFKAKQTCLQQLTLKTGTFPIAKKLKSKTHLDKTVHFRDESNSSMGTQLSEASIVRPKNQFILARTLLNKIARMALISNTSEGTSKVISIVWSGKNDEFRRYFRYLSDLEEAWHEMYFPHYYYQPKKCLITPYNVASGNNTLFSFNCQTERDAQEKQAGLIKDEPSDFELQAKCSRPLPPGFEDYTSHLKLPLKWKSKDSYQKLCISSISLKGHYQITEQNSNKTLKYFRIGKPSFVIELSTRKRTMFKRRRNKAIEGMSEVAPLFYKAHIEDIYIK